MKIFIWIVASIFGLFLIAILGILLYVRFGIKITQKEHFEETRPYVWNEIEIGEPAVCSDGSDYRIFTKKGNTDNLIIYFSGGGVCWDGASCTEPLKLTNLQGYYFPSVSNWVVKLVLHGISENDREDNPFKEWNIVYLPYCTADFHIGNRAVEYTNASGESITVHHSGKSNVSKALDWIFSTFPDPRKVLITGESAGGFGNIFWTPAIARHYPEAGVYQLSDCSFIQSDLWPGAAATWGAQTPEPLAFDITYDIFGDALFSAADQLTDRPITFLNTYSLYDQVLTDFSGRMNGPLATQEENIQAWSNQMRAAVRTYSDSLDNYFYFIGECSRNEDGTTPHTYLAMDSFYSCREGGLSVSEWLGQNILEERPVSVGERYVIK